MMYTVIKVPINHWTSKHALLCQFFKFLYLTNSEYKIKSTLSYALKNVYNVNAMHTYSKKSKLL